MAPETPLVRILRPIFVIFASVGMMGVKLEGFDLFRKEKRTTTLSKFGYWFLYALSFLTLYGAWSFSQTVIPHISYTWHEFFLYKIWISLIVVQGILHRLFTSLVSPHYLKLYHLAGELGEDVIPRRELLRTCIPQVAVMSFFILAEKVMIGILGITCFCLDIAGILVLGPCCAIAILSLNLVEMTFVFVVGAVKLGLGHATRRLESIFVGDKKREAKEVIRLVQLYRKLLVVLHLYGDRGAVFVLVDYIRVTVLFCIQVYFMLWSILEAQMKGEASNKTMAVLSSSSVCVSFVGFFFVSYSGENLKIQARKLRIAVRQLDLYCEQNKTDSNFKHWIKVLKEISSDEVEVTALSFFAYEYNNLFSLFGMLLSYLPLLLQTQMVSAATKLTATDINMAIT